MARNKSDNKAAVEEIDQSIDAEAKPEAPPISTLDKNRIAKVNDVMTRRYGANWAKA